jgi:hypothetical protein
MTGQQRVPRFRIVLEVSFPDADFVYPSGYQETIDRWKESLQNNQAVRSQEVLIRELLLINQDVDDYADWRYRRPEYDPSSPRKGMGRIVGREKPDNKS